MQPWIESYVKALPTEELARLKYLTSLRESPLTISWLDLDKDVFLLKFLDAMMDPGDGTTHGKLIYQHDQGMPGAENVIPLGVDR
jgi:hypothetical protein